MAIHRKTKDRPNALARTLVRTFFFFFFFLRILFRYHRGGVGGDRVANREKRTKRNWRGVRGCWAKCATGQRSSKLGGWASPRCRRVDEGGVGPPSSGLPGCSSAGLRKICSGTASIRCRWLNRGDGSHGASAAPPLRVVGKVVLGVDLRSGDAHVSGHLADRLEHRVQQGPHEAAPHPVHDVQDHVEDAQRGRQQPHVHQ